MEKKISKRELIEWLRKIEVTNRSKESDSDSVSFELNRLIDEIGIRGVSEFDNSGTFPINQRNIVDLVDKTTIKVPDIESMRNNKHH